MNKRSKIVRILIPMFAMALACAMATTAFAAQGQAPASGADGLKAASAVATQADPIDISSATVTVPAQTYTGSALTPAATVTLGSETLSAGTDYPLDYNLRRNYTKSNYYALPLEKTFGRQQAGFLFGKFFQAK